jgi:uncharacterized protein DUF262
MSRQRSPPSPAAATRAKKREPTDAISNRRRNDQEPYGDEQIPKVDELVSDISNGTLKLPEFQRGYIWSPQQVRTYVQSLYRGQPIGHFLVWHTISPVKTRGADVAPRHAADYFAAS